VPHYKTIHLIRHFKVDVKSDKKLFNSKEIDEWVKEYDNSDLEFLDLTIPKHDVVYDFTSKRD
jgi:hypothetical protein